MTLRKSFAAIAAATILSFSGAAWACEDGQCPLHGDGKMCDQAARQGGGQDHTQGTCQHGKHQQHGQSHGDAQGHTKGHAQGHAKGHAQGHAKGQALDTPLTIQDVTQMMERKLEWRGNARLKLGSVTQTDDNTITVEITTQSGALVEKYAIDSATGSWIPLND